MPDQFDSASLNSELINALLATQVPKFCDLPVEEIKSGGTDNAMFQLGKRNCLRFPLSEHAAEKLNKEVSILGQLKSRPLTIPEVVFVGKPCEFFNANWAIYNWMPGNDCFTQPPNNSNACAKRLAQFILSLRTSPADERFLSGEQNNARGLPLRELIDPVRRSIDIVQDEFDAEQLKQIWTQSLNAPVHVGAPVWVHGDLHAGNLITHDGQLTGVVDFGLAGIGDPAVDLLPAWWIFDRPARAIFKSALNVDEAQWARGRGWALGVALIAYSYYRGSDKTQLTQMSRKAICELLEEGA